MPSIPLETSGISKVLIIKYAPVKYFKLDREGNGIPTNASRITKNGIVTQDSTDGEFDDLARQEKVIVYESQSLEDPESTEEHLITQEYNEMLVYDKIIFYKSSATSGSEETKRLNTWIPSLGLDDKSSHGLGSKGDVFKITKLDTLYDPRFRSPDERIKKYEKYLGKDLMMRFIDFNIMLMSAEIGGGFWDTDDGKQLINCLIKEGFIIETGIVKINKEAVHQFEVPYEVKQTDSESIAKQTQLFNDFFRQSQGCLHSGLYKKEQKHTASRNICQEIHDLANKATKKNENPKTYIAFLKLTHTRADEYLQDKQPILEAMENQIIFLYNQGEIGRKKCIYLLSLYAELRSLNLDNQEAYTAFRSKFISPAYHKDHILNKFRSWYGSLFSDKTTSMKLVITIDRFIQEKYRSKNPEEIARNIRRTGSLW